MAADHVGDGIRVNAVSPGTADTPWIGRLMARATDPAKAIESLKHRQPMGRLVTVDEVAFAICYLASPLCLVHHRQHHQHRRRHDRPAHADLTTVAPTAVRRLDYGYFVRPAAEQQAVVVPCLGYLVEHAEGLLLLDTGMGQEPELDAYYRPYRRSLQVRAGRTQASDLRTSRWSSTATCTSTTAAATPS